MDLKYGLHMLLFTARYGVQQKPMWKMQLHWNSGSQQQVEHPRLSCDAVFPAVCRGAFARNCFLTIFNHLNLKPSCKGIYGTKMFNVNSTKVHCWSISLLYNIHFVIYVYMIRVLRSIKVINLFSKNKKVFISLKSHFLRY